MNDGTARVMVFDPAEDEHAWIKVNPAQTQSDLGYIQDCVVLPGQGGATSAEDLKSITSSRAKFSRDAHLFSSSAGRARMNVSGHRVSREPNSLVSCRQQQFERRLCTAPHWRICLRVG